MHMYQQTIVVVRTFYPSAMRSICKDMVVDVCVSVLHVVILFTRSICEGYSSYPSPTCSVMRGYIS